MRSPMQSYNENHLKNHLISTDISAKLDTVPICIVIGIGIRISIGPLSPLLHIIINQISQESE